MGREELLVGLSPCNQITIKHHSSSMDALAMVSCHWPAAKCSEGAKATELFLELVAGKPSLIITAHGTLVGAQRRPGTPRHSDMRLCTVPHDGLSSGGAHPAAWLLEHHGDHMYTIRNTTNGHHMYLTDQGMLSVDNSGSVDYPDPRALFTLELAWTGTNSQASTATPHHDEEFVALAAGHCIAGFTIKPFVKVDGRQLCVCALPDGRLMTAFAQRHVTRWELFTIADKEAVLDSPLELLDRLPCVPFAETARGMRRSSSCQAVFSGHQCTTPRKSMATSSSSSFLPGIREAEEEALLPDATPQPLEWKTGLQSMKGGRRCLSDSALTVRS